MPLPSPRSSQTWPCSHWTPLQLTGLQVPVCGLETSCTQVSVGAQPMGGLQTSRQRPGFWDMSHHWSGPQAGLHATGWHVPLELQ